MSLLLSSCRSVFVLFCFAFVFAFAFAFFFGLLCYTSKMEGEQREREGKRHGATLGSEIMLSERLKIFAESGRESDREGAGGGGETIK